MLTVRLPFDVTLRLQASWLITVAAIFAFCGMFILPQQFQGLSARWIWAAALLTTALYCLSLILHELGHAAAASRLGLPVDGIHLHLFGGVLLISGIPRRPWEELLLALSGPLVSLVLGGVFLGLGLLLQMIPAEPAQVLGYVSVLLAVYNLAALLLNMIPVYPMDGGRAVRALLWAATGRFRLSIDLAMVLGVVLVGLLLAGGLLLPRHYLFLNLALLMLAVSIARMAWQGYWRMRELCAVRIEDCLDEQLPLEGGGNPLLSRSLADGVSASPAPTSKQPLEGGAHQITCDQEYAASGPGFVVRCDTDGRAVEVVEQRVLAAGDEDGDAGITAGSVAESAGVAVTPEDCVAADAVAIDVMPRLQMRADGWLVVVDDGGRCCGLVTRQGLENCLAGL